MKHLYALLIVVLALVAFAGAHYVMWLDGLNQWEQAAYLSFQGYCKQPDALCVQREEKLAALATDGVVK